MDFSSQKIKQERPPLLWGERFPPVVATLRDVVMMFLRER
jgi:hypothetical protein